MRLKQYINESEELSFEEAMEKIETHCIPYLKELKNVNKALLSGRRKKSSIFKGKVRKNRKPVDTPMELHNYIDDYFKSSLGVEPRSNSLFANFSAFTTSNYGDVYFIFPVGRYKIVFNPDVLDLFNEIVDSDFNWKIAVYDEWPPYIMDEFERDWEEKYGEGQAGQFVYNDFETGEKVKNVAVGVVMNEKFPNLEIGTEEYDDKEWEVFSELEWEPEVNMDDFVDDKVKEAKRETKDLIDDILSGYIITTDLSMVTIPEVEVMLMCDEYYAIDYNEYKKQVYDYLRENHNIKLR